MEREASRRPAGGLQGSWRDQNGLDGYCCVLRDMDWFGRNTGVVEIRCGSRGRRQE